MRLAPALRAALLATPVATVLTGAACARRVPVDGAGDTTTTTAAAPAERRPGREEPVVLVVENRNSSDVVVTVLGAGGRRLRAGTVSGSSTRSLAFPGSITAASQPVAFLAHPVGARDSYTSERVVVQPGQQVVLTVAPRLAQSSVRLQ